MNEVAEEEKTPKTKEVLSQIDESTLTSCASCGLSLSSTLENSTNTNNEQQLLQPSIPTELSSLLDVLIPLKVPSSKFICPSCVQLNLKALKDRSLLSPIALSAKCHDENGTPINDGDGRKWSLLPPQIILGTEYPIVNCLQHRRDYFPQKFAVDTFGYTAILDDIEHWWLFPDALFITKKTHPLDFARLLELGIIEQASSSSSSPESDKMILITVASFKHFAACLSCKNPTFWNLLCSQLTPERYDLLFPTQQQSQQKVVSSVPSSNTVQQQQQQQQLVSQQLLQSSGGIPAKMVSSPSQQSNRGIFHSQSLSDGDLRSTLMTFSLINKVQQPNKISTPKKQVQEPPTFSSPSMQPPPQKQIKLQNGDDADNSNNEGIIVNTEMNSSSIIDDINQIDEATLLSMEQEAKIMKVELDQINSLANSVHEEIQEVMAGKGLKQPEIPIPQMSWPNQPQQIQPPSTILNMLLPISKHVLIPTQKFTAQQIMDQTLCTQQISDDVADQYRLAAAASIQQQQQQQDLMYPAIQQRRNNGRILK